MKTATEVDVSQLNSFLRGELSAVETYMQAIAKLDDEPNLRAKLEDCRMSHLRRVALLREEIARRGGEPAEGSGVWGALAQLVEGGAKVFGKKAAIAALEEGEDHGRDDYRAELANLDSDVRSFVEAHLLPEQLRTHDTLSALSHAL
jgi:demethoxyubiquinone hydroxylase (CLK1/Coq7/Cat5 family)